MTLLNLPNELLLSITETLDSQNSINALAKTNRRCYNLLNSFLYAYNVRHQNGSALHWAAKHGQLEAVQESLRQGADIESQDRETKVRPLIEASRSGHANIVSLLVAHGANVHAKDTSRSKGAITFAVQRNKPAVVRLLLDIGVDPNSVDLRGSSLLHLAAEEYPSSRAALTRVLIDKGANVESTSQCADTPLQVASVSNSVEVARCLIECGADLDKRTREGKTLLHLAVSKGHIEFAELLLDKGAAMESRDADGYTPLHMACFNGQIQIANVLLDRGADLEAISSTGNTPLLMAVLWESSASKVKDSTLGQITSFLLERGANPARGNESGVTPLHVTVSRGHAVLCKMLLQHGVNPEPRTSTGITPLHKIPVGGSLQLAAYLLHWGAGVQPRDEDGNTPLHLAARRCFPGLVELLLEAGADPVTKNNKGQLPVDLAVQETVGRSKEKRVRHLEVMDLLEQSPMFNGS